MKRWLKRIGFYLGTLALLLLLFVAIEHVRGRWALNHYLSLLKAKGEEISVARLEPPHPPKNENIANDLVELTNRFQTILNNVADAAPPSLRFAGPGKGIVAWRLTQWSYGPKTPNNWSTVGAQLDQAGELLDLVHSAAKKSSYDSEFDYSKGFMDFSSWTMTVLSETKRVALLLNVATLYELKNGNLDAANRHLCDLVKLAAVQHPEPLIISQLVRQACAAIAFAATWQALQAPGWNDSQLAELQSAWEGCDFVGDMDGALKMERGLNFDIYEQIKNSDAKLVFGADELAYAQEMAGSIFGSLPGHGFLVRRVYFPVWRVAWADQDELRDAQSWQSIIERETVARKQSWTALRIRFDTEDITLPEIASQQDREQMGWYDRLRFLFSGATFSVNDSEIRLALGTQVQQQMSITVIAINRYRLQTGMLPVDLAALVPKYLRALPRDSMDGKTLRYRLQPGVGFVLYSVGEDGKDNGGDSTLRKDEKYYTRIWDGRDAVWPTPATDKEAAVAAMKATK